MSKVSNILARKKSGVISVSPQQSVLTALKIMSERNIGSLVVIENEAFLGIMTERDYARKVILQDKHSDNTQVGDIMSTNYPHISPNDSIEYCMQLMSKHNLRYLPVFTNGVLSGIVSILDLIQETIEKQRETINDLQDFISLTYR